MNIMFICTGNICRSAMAHKLFEKKIKDEKMDKDIKVYSCGTYAENGSWSTYDAIDVMEEYNVNLKTHRATNIKDSKIKDMDIILCATTNHKMIVLQLYPEFTDKVFTMKEYVNNGEYKNINISDPWGYGISIYRKCAEEIDECLEKLIKKLKNNEKKIIKEI